MHNRAGGSNSFPQVIYAKPFERDRLEMLLQYFFRICISKNPFVQCVGICFCTEIFFKFFLLVSLKNHLGRFKALQEFICIFAVAFSNEKFTGADVKKCKTVFIIFSEMDPG